MASLVPSYKVKYLVRTDDKTMNNRNAHAAFETGWPLVEPSPDRYCGVNGGRNKEKVKKDGRRQDAWLLQMTSCDSMKAKPRDIIEQEGG